MYLVNLQIPNYCPQNVPDADSDPEVMTPLKPYSDPEVMTPLKPYTSSDPENDGHGERTQEKVVIVSSGTTLKGDVIIWFVYFLLMTSHP